MPSNKKPINSEGIFTTDDSGKVISLEEYASLHGEDNSVNWDKIVNTKKPLPKEHRNLFQEIANLKESLPQRASSKIRCIYCQKFIEKDKIKEHNNQAHPNEILFSPKNKTRIKNLGAKRKSEPHNFLAPEGQEGNIAEKLRQALDESRYGGKGMHHRHESDGTFGSTPLHDDYGDESDSD